jgi:hypothetical protein
LGPLSQKATIFLKSKINVFNPKEHLITHRKKGYYDLKRAIEINLTDYSFELFFFWRIVNLLLV